MKSGEFKSRFYNYCNNLKIDSKEHGIIPFKLNGCQKFLVDEIADGLDNDIRHFTVLKARQLGISTVLLALDNFWPTYHSGIQGAIVTDTDDNSKFFRSALTLMHEGLPKSLKIPVRQHNSQFLLWRNHSRLFYLVAGTKKKGNLGRAKGINYLHATESSSWVDEEGLRSLYSSLAEENPDRFYIFESTARGFNLFYDIWNTAKRAHSQKAIFIAWWMNENYSIPSNDRRFQTYWDNQLSQEEYEWVTEVKELYDFEIQPEQMAWWRWKLEELINDLQLMYQEFPPTENHAFILSGRRFFSTVRLTEDFKKAHLITPDFAKYSFGANFYDTEIKETNEYNADLSIWEGPKNDGVYVVGADAAFGGSERADASSAQILRCYSDRVEQVAEYRSPYHNTTQFAWVLAHLCGAYAGKFQQCMLNLETNGPGKAVLDELNKIQDMTTAIPKMLLDEERTLYNVIPCIGYFIGINPRGVHAKDLTYGWTTSKDSRAWILNTYKSIFEQNLISVYSPWLLREMRYIAQDGREIITEGAAKDDRVIAMSLAVYYWYMYIIPELKRRNMTFDLEKKRAEVEKRNPDRENAITRIVMEHFEKKGIYDAETG